MKIQVTAIARDGVERNQRLVSILEVDKIPELTEAQELLEANLDSYKRMMGYEIENILCLGRSKKVYKRKK